MRWQSEEEERRKRGKKKERDSVNVKNQDSDRQRRKRRRKEHKKHRFWWQKKVKVNCHENSERGGEERGQMGKNRIQLVKVKVALTVEVEADGCTTLALVIFGNHLVLSCIFQGNVVYFHGHIVDVT